MRPIVALIFLAGCTGRNPEFDDGGACDGGATDGGAGESLGEPLPDLMPLCGRLGEVCCNNNACSTPSLTCVGSLCVCARTTPIVCGGACVNTMMDALNCGGCGMICPSGRCAMAVCQLDCAPGSANCDNNPSNGCEVDLNTDAQNCGGCTLRCSSINGAGTCVGGVCTFACLAGFGDCDRDGINGCESLLVSDSANCGACGVACVGQICASGSCISCGLGFTACGQQCVDLTTNSANCGGCGAMCAGGQHCCSSTCSNPTIDASNCGGCGIACSAANGSARCATGMCAINACNPGFADCDGVYVDGCETNTNTSVNNCGACNGACNLVHAQPTCTAGKCAVSSCDFPYADCDGLPANGCEINLRTDAAHCGSCALACAAGHLCVAGVCV